METREFRMKLKPISTLLAHCETLDDEVVNLMCFNPFDYADDTVSLQAKLTKVSDKFKEFYEVNTHTYDRLTKGSSMSLAQKTRIRRLELRTDVRQLLDCVREMNVTIDDLNLSLINNSTFNTSFSPLIQPRTFCSSLCCCCSSVRSSSGSIGSTTCGRSNATPHTFGIIQKIHRWLCRRAA